MSFQSRDVIGAVAWTLAAVVALFLLLSPASAQLSEVLLPLPNVAIPSAHGKTLSSDIIEIDQQAHLMYFADRTAHGIDVFDVRTPSAKYLMTIPTGEDPNGITVAKNVNKLFVGGAKSNVIIIDIDPMSMHKNTVIAKLNTGGKHLTDKMDYDPVDMKLYAANSDDGIVVSVDAVRNRIVKAFTDLGEGLEQPRYNPSDGMMYLTSSDQNTLFKFDPRRDALVTKWKLPVACDPNGLAINPKTNIALLGCSDKKSNHTVFWDLKAGRVATLVSGVWAGDSASYSAKSNIYFFAVANRPTGPVLATFAGGPSPQLFATTPTFVGSHAVAYDETNRVVYLQDQRPNSGSLLAFWVSSLPITTPTIPSFPWPPPAASATAIVTRDLLEVQQGPTRLQDVDRIITNALDSNGYSGRSYFAVPSGFALVTGLEQIEPDGTSKQGPHRWMLEQAPTQFTLQDYFKALFTANPGYYRVIVFVVTPYPLSQSAASVTPQEAQEWLREGVNQLPASIGTHEFSHDGYACTALIYEFERATADDEPKILLPGPISGRMHLVKAGIWEAFQRRTR